ncbi:patatin-like phospholipase family protein [Mesorhizobium sp. M0047]|uniref:patatin-like phospholipase family protein n=1 Tax=Mesorhizobium sp. M0047 TaxID=2956859 RepID=UPI00333D1B44
MTSDTIRSKLAELSATDIFGANFLSVFGDSSWNSDTANQTAAHQFRVELISRIATARLAYGSGTEKRALESVAELFGKARAITANNVGCGTFEILVWHTLNVEVRPFTAKWHPLSRSGVLDALDSSDVFRTELYQIQNILRVLERALALLTGTNASYDPSRSASPGVGENPPREAEWRPAGGHETYGDHERAAVQRRRERYGVSHGDWAAGIALSGGGIRSATFSLGVLAALSRKNLLPQFDYLSTVSGGGYAGCFLTSLLGTSNPDEGFGLLSDQEPFKRTERESDHLARVRQRASFLSAGFVERLLLVMRSTYGVFVNAVLALSVIAFVAAVELVGRTGLQLLGVPTWLGWACPIFALVLLSNVSRQERLQLSELTVWHLSLGLLFCFPLLWIAFGAFHVGITRLTGNFALVAEVGPLLATLLVTATAIAILGSIFAVFARARSMVIPVVTGAFLLLAEHAFYASFEGQDLEETLLILAIMAVAIGLLWCLVDVNETSLYRYYRSKLATAFIPTGGTNVSPRLSEFEPDLSFYPIINCALNAPGSDDPKMRGRLSDVFTFTPLMTGSNLVGYQDTKAWEDLNPKLDLAAAMALSGAAVSPQMGLRTTKQGSFWLTLFNMRLNAWLRKPGIAGNNQAAPIRGRWRRDPGIQYLFRELMASASERLPYVNISDGGHIENLGVYELLRRRCRYIVAVDGEADPKMTFHALTNLQRLAYIDMGIMIDAELDEIRLLDTGFSRSHFRFCRIRYPTGDAREPWEIGYLLYVKLSLTGNEGEFLRRYRLDEPSFPHHSTLDQFFSETQFEAYRSLGEHIGDKLFMKAIIGDLETDSIGVKEWMQKYAEIFGEIPPT